jgi:hypothetical protein
MARPRVIRTPGTMPARNSCEIEVLVTTPYRIIGIDGGMMMPTTDEATMIAAASGAG